MNFAQVPMDDDMEEVLIGSSGYTEQVFWQNFFVKRKVVQCVLSGVLTQILQARGHGR